MARPTYEQLERRIQELEEALGASMDAAAAAHDEDVFELSVLYNISRHLASTRDLDQLLRIIVEEVNKALLAEGAGVLLYDENRGDLYWRQVRDARHILDPQSEDLRLPLDGSIAGWVYRHNKPARVNDTLNDPRYYPGLTEKSGFAIRKVLQVPLNTGDKTIGVLMIMNKIGGDFSEQDEALVVSMAPGIALAIENATVYEKLKKSREALEMIYRSSMALATTMDLEHLLSVVANELNRVMETEAAGVLLYDPKKNDLYWKEVQDERDLIGSKAAQLRIPIEGSISGRVFRTGEPAVVNDTSTDPEFFHDFETASGFIIRNEIIVPLNTREETIGVLLVLNKKKGNFSQDDVNLCVSLAGVVAIAVENATFFAELLRSYRELENLNLVKSKILNHLSHELRTPLAILQGTLATMERKLKERGIEGFERAMARMSRHIHGLNRLESQVESIMMTGYVWERRMITDFLECALTLMDVQAERTPEIAEAARIIRKWLEKTFPIRQDEPERINVKDFAETLMGFIRANMEHENRSVNLHIDFDENAELLIPGHVLHAVIEGLVRNAIEATPDSGDVWVTGKIHGDRFTLTVKDTGIGIPESARDLIFEGFCPVQETEDYSSGRPYSFNAGGKGIDLLRIRMFSELYGFKPSFTSKRCSHLGEAAEKKAVDSTICPVCRNERPCVEGGGSEFTIDFPLAPPK
jgi:GAF domain-containing protein